MLYLVLDLGIKDPIQLRFVIRDNPIAAAWLERMGIRDTWPLDDPTRFYNFDSVEQQITHAETYIRTCINTINSYQHIIDRPFTSIKDQDCLNYLHHIFETYHGLLDQQTHDFWVQAPKLVQTALAELNIAVHRCESVGSNNPRLVCTWFGMPKIYKLDPAIAKQYGSMTVPFGTVCLNYAEIGKTVEDLSYDQDQYIGDDAFQPWRHYSADFFVPFFDIDNSIKLPVMEKYIQEHQDFFLARGIENVHNIHAMPLRYPVADLQDTRSKEDLIELIAQRQHVTQVSIE